MSNVQHEAYTSFMAVESEASSKMPAINKDRYLGGTARARRQSCCTGHPFPAATSSSLICSHGMSVVHNIQAVTTAHRIRWSVRQALGRLEQAQVTDSTFAAAP